MHRRQTVSCRYQTENLLIWGRAGNEKLFKPCAYFGKGAETAEPYDDFLCYYFRAACDYDFQCGRYVYSDTKWRAAAETWKLAYPVGARVTQMLANPCVMRLMELKRKVLNEAHLFKEFLRFDELKGGVLYGKIEPKCDVLPFVSQHFEARFPEEDWIIYDEKRKKAAVHKHGMDIIVVEGQDIEQLTKELQTEDEYRELWKVFFNTIGIESRYNPKCQQNHMPEWYRRNMTEFE